MWNCGPWGVPMWGAWWIAPVFGLLFIIVMMVFCARMMRGRCVVPRCAAMPRAARPTRATFAARCMNRARRSNKFAAAVEPRGRFYAASYVARRRPSNDGCRAALAVQNGRRWDRYLCR